MLLDTSLGEFMPEKLYGGKLVPVEEVFRPIPYNGAAAKHFASEEIDALNEQGRLAFELRPKQMRYIPPENLSKKDQREIFRRRGTGPLARYAPRRPADKERSRHA